MPSSQAQVVPDNSLPRNTSVTRSGNIIVITGGTEAQRHLFHSFQEFSPQDLPVSFQGVDDITHVFARVTGSRISDINSRIEILQSNGIVSPANLFLLNPNGIIFGSNASLNIGGSFLATTANQINFADGGQFSALSSEASLPLTVSVPVGLQFGRNPGAISAQSTVALTDAGGESKLDLFGLPIQGMSVLPNETLALVGGDVSLKSGGLIAEGGRIEVGSIASSGQVSLTVLNRGFRLGYADPLEFGKIRFIGTSQQSGAVARLHTSGVGGGMIQIQGDRITLNDAVILADTLGDRDGQLMAIRGENLLLDNFSIISTATYGTGRGGNIHINVGQLTVQGQSQILATTETEAGAQGGNLWVNADSILLVGGADSPGGSAGLFVRTSASEDEDATGTGGGLRISTDRLQIENGAQISTTTTGSGDAGTLTVNAIEIELVGVERDSAGRPTIDPNSQLGFPSGLIGGTTSSGKGANIAIFTDRLSLQQGAALQTSTLGRGRAGDLLIHANRIEVAGTSLNNVFPSGILSLSGGIPGTNYQGFLEATGRGGRIDIITGQLLVREGAIIATGSINPDRNVRAGDLNISAQTLSLIDRSGLLTNTDSGNGGRMTLQVTDLLLLRRDSEISTTAGIEGRGGNGGSITINNRNNPSEAGLIVAVPNENSDIIANADVGRGGNVEITAQQIFGFQALNRDELQRLQPQLDPRRLPTSDITAISQFSPDLSGAVTFNRPDIDPTQGLVELPTIPLDRSQQIAQTCAPRTGQDSFVMSGRGGLPLSPNNALRSPATLNPGWISLDSETDLTDDRFENQSQTTVEPSIVEASGWVRDVNGNLKLIARSIESAHRHQPCSVDVP